MDVVTPLAGTTQVSEPNPSTSGVPELGREVFLRLLVTQLQSQDPTAPVQNEDFVAQLAQFTSLEQATNTNELLESLIGKFEKQSQWDLVNLIGHKVVAEGNTVALDETGETTLVYVLNDDAASVEIDVFDEKGSVVGTLQNLDPQNAGRHEIVWDGNDSSGDRVEAGTYEFRVRAKNAQEGQVSVMTFMTEIVKGVIWDQDQPHLTLGSGRMLPSSNILSVQ